MTLPVRHVKPNPIHTFRGITARRDGGILGNWPRTGREVIARVSTFDPRRISASDYISIQRRNALMLDIFGHNPTHSREEPFFQVSFRSADTPFIRRDTATRGFFYYYVPVPERPLSGGLRFRSCSSPSMFAKGSDIADRFGMPWTVPLPRLLTRNGRAVLQSLLRDNLVSLPDLVSCYATFGERVYPRRPILHGLGQTWPLDLSQTTTILVPGPHSLIACELYPAIARYGQLIVSLELTGNPNIPHEVGIRVMEIRSRLELLPQFSKISAPVPGSFLANPTADGNWVWNSHTPESPSFAAALLCLLNGPGKPRYPSMRQRRKMDKWFYNQLPTEQEFERYMEQWPG